MSAAPAFMHPAALRPGIVLACGIAGFTAFNAFMPEHAKSVGLSGSQWVFATYSVGCLAAAHRRRQVARAGRLGARRHDRAAPG